jgi:hypothetical protein
MSWAALATRPGSAHAQSDGVSPLTREDARFDAKAELSLAADACPSPELVREMLEPLVGHQHALRLHNPSAAQPPDVQVRDLGDDYRIQVEGVQRDQSDPARNCKERARVAAVFIALNLQAPPAKAEPVAPPTPPLQRAPAPVAPAAPQPSRQRTPAIEVGLGAYASVAYAPQDSVAPGGALELWLRRELLLIGVRVGAAGESKLAVTPHTAGGHASLLRLPGSIFAGLLWPISRWQLGPSLGLAFDLLRARGRGLVGNDSIWRANLGAYLGLQAQVSLTDRLSLAALLSGSFYPRSYKLRVEPDNRHADTPNIWLAAQLGLLLRLR